MPFYLYSVLSPTLPENNISAVTNVSSLWSTCEMNIYSFFKNNLGPKQGDKGGGSWNEYHYTDNCLKTEPSPTAVHWSSIPLNKVFRVIKLSNNRKTAFPVSSAVGSWAHSINLPWACPRGAGSAWSTVENHPGILPPTASGGSGPSWRLPTSSHLGIAYVTVGSLWVGSVCWVLLCIVGT